MQVREGYAEIESVDDFLEAVGQIGAETGSTVQVFDARYVVDRTHLERATTLANRERSRGEAIATDLAMEIMLYAAGRRQIRRALEMGVSAGECPVVGVVVGGAEQRCVDRLGGLLEPAATLGEYDPERVCEFYDISAREREATAGSLADIVHERVAMLVVER